jgi:ABC-type branched-subunit amino acid transport system ATPase component
VAAAFEAEGLGKRYGDTTALRDVSLAVEEGEIVALLGPNGAGKSTLAKIACGLVRPSSGAAWVGGDPAGSAPARAAVGYLAELFRFPGWASACTSGSRALRAGARNVRSSSSWSGSATRPPSASRRCPRGCSSGSGSRRR